MGSAGLEVTIRSVVSKRFVPAILHGSTGAATLLLCFLTDIRIPISIETAKILGLPIVGVGMALFVWAAAFIRKGAIGIVEPRKAVLVDGGPYRFVRHPIYLGQTIAMIGAAIATRSVLGFIGAVFFFLPSEIYRAALEEKALSVKFQGTWSAYSEKTPFFLPNPQEWVSRLK